VNWDCFVARASLRKRFAFVAGNDGETLRPTKLSNSQNHHAQADLLLPSCAGLTRASIKKESF
jgi:hypothetical protein